MKRKTSLSIAGKLSAIILGMILISTVSIGVFGYLLYRHDTIRLGGERALSIAQAVASNVDPESMAQAMAQEQPDAQWEQVKRMADNTAVRTNAHYLYILGAEYDDAFTYYLEGYNPITGDEELVFGDQEALYDESGLLIYADEMFETLADGVPRTTDAYQSGEFGTMVSGLAPITAEDGRIVGVVGVDLLIDNVLAGAHGFALKTLLIVLGFSMLFGALSAMLIRRIVGHPIGALTDASEQIARGNLNVPIDARSDDEIGRLSAAFREMIVSTQRQIEMLEALSNGDLSVTVTPRSEHDMMSLAITRMATSLNETFAAFYKSSDQLAQTSVHIAGDAKSLADGAEQQRLTIENLALSIGHITTKTQENADMAQKATQLVEAIREDAEKGSLQMEQMVTAVTQINEASRSISKVMQAIDDIAFQTNILALNAAVEAARAGQHGKGFAVVAEEVRSLASKSAASAKETGTLIANSLEKAALGVQIAADTSETFENIVTGIQENGRIVAGISEASSEQNREITDVNRNIDQVTGVVQRTNDTALESAAASDKLRDQAQQLKSLLSQFHLRTETQRLLP
ncbi:MAG: methyl-accepting chemotaxis protein [Oscillospiraceae bacterium]|jgi:methyl-accepting chemotaxis protein|nr:methyl-accepting chemotaxis protein [Oscillospiraceae bacterium]